jgi:pyrroline-5-carboxylate reductase
MVLETGQHPGALKDMVASPGGTTIAGLHELERAGVRGALMNAVEAATRRAMEDAPAQVVVHDQDGTIQEERTIEASTT